MYNFYIVIILLCILSMIFLSIDVGKSTVLSSLQIIDFRATFIFVAVGAVCECLGVVFDIYGCQPVWIHSIITCMEYIITPFLTIFLAKSCGIEKSIVPMTWLMLVHTVLEIVLLPFKLIIEVDSNGVFIRGPLQWVYLTFCGLSFIYIIIVFIYLGKKNGTHSIISISLIAVILVIGQVAVILDDQIFTGYISICMTAILLYMYTQDFIRNQMLRTISNEQTIANHDSLTGVSSRICFERKASELNELIRINPETPAFAVCECDLNNLKIINDSYGHDVGDGYIKKCCKSICNLFKHSPVYRIGGDEFVIILQNEDLSGFEEMKTIVQDFTIAEAAKPGDLIERISYAAGFAIYDAKEDNSVADVLKRADKAMYVNKKEIKKILLEK